MSNPLHHTRKWKNLRLHHILQYPLCKACEGKNIVKSADEVDHIVPVSVEPERFFDPTNLQSLCRNCHWEKTARENSTRPDNLIVEDEKWDEAFRNEYNSD